MALFEPGAELARYTILGKLATGGMSEVYLARQSGPSGFSKVMVLKVILPHLAEDPEFVQMFHNEAKLAALLNHPNVVQIYDFGMHDDVHYMAMEYIDGQNLHRIMDALEEDGNNMPWPYAIRAVSDASGALEYAHNLSDPMGNPMEIIHRDVSLDNIVVTYSGQIKLLDFGIAKARDMESYTGEGALRGKYLYMAPELIRGDVLDHRADIFSLGVVIYRVLLGQMPFVGSNHAQLIDRIVNLPPPRPRELDPSLPDELERIVLKTLHKDRNQRYLHAGELQIDLEAYLLGTGTAVMPYHMAQFMNSLFPPGRDQNRETYRSLAGASLTPSTPGRISRRELYSHETVIMTEEEALGTQVVDPSTRGVPSPFHPVIGGQGVADLGATHPDGLPPVAVPGPMVQEELATLYEKAPVLDDSTPVSEEQAADFEGQPQGISYQPTLIHGLNAGLTGPLPGEGSTGKQAGAVVGAGEYVEDDPTYSQDDKTPPEGPPPLMAPSPSPLEEAAGFHQSATEELGLAPSLIPASQEATVIAIADEIIGKRRVEDEEEPDDEEPDEKEPDEKEPDEKEQDEKEQDDEESLTSAMEPAVTAAVTPRRSRWLFIFLLVSGILVLSGGATATYLLLTPSRSDVPFSPPPTKVQAKVGEHRAAGKGPSAERLLPDAATLAAGQARQDKGLAGRLPDGSAATATDLAPAATTGPEVPGPAPPPTPGETGMLSVKVSLPGEVLLDGKRLSALPLQSRVLPAGTHRLVVRSTQLGYMIFRQVRIKGGDHVRLSLAPQKGSIRVLVRPWAKVTLDRKVLGTTPLPPAAVYEGPHLLKLENSNLKVTKQMRVTVRAGKETVIKVRLE